MNGRVLRLLMNNLLNHGLQRLSLRFGWAIDKPTEIAGLVTMRCNLRCRQCDIWKERDKYSQEELTTDQWRQVLLDLKRWLGTYRIGFSGGEPFLRRDMVDLLGFCAQHGIFASVVTNGYLMTQELARAVMGARPLNVNVSLDGGRATTHDWLRGVDGAFQRATDALCYLNDYKRVTGSRTALIVKTTIMEPNLTELLNLVAWVDEERLTGVMLQPLQDNLGGSQNDPLWFKTHPLWPKDSKLTRDVLKGLIALKKEGARILNADSHLRSMIGYFENPLSGNRGCCPVGVRNFAITYCGRVEQCYLVMPPFGDVTKQSVQEVPVSPEGLESRRRIRSCRRYCLATCHAKQTLSEKVELLLRLRR